MINTFVERFLTSKFVIQALFFIAVASSLYAGILSQIGDISVPIAIAYFIFSFLIPVLLSIWRRVRTINSVDSEVSSHLFEAHDFSYDDKGIVVFLRPFITEGKLVYRHTSFIRDLKGALFGGFLLDPAELESSLFGVFRENYVTLRFDTTDSANHKRQADKLLTFVRDRFGSYSVDAGQHDWLNLVLDSVSKALLCFIIPPADKQSSTATEITNLIANQELRAKLVFIMLPESKEIKISKNRNTSAPLLWSNLISLCEQVYRLPRYDRNGGLVIHIEKKPFFVNAHSGRAWFSSKSLKKLFVDKRLTDSILLDSLRISGFLSFGILAYTFIMLAIVAVVGSEVLPENLSISESTEVIVASTLFVALYILNFLAYIRYCSRFLLGPSLSTLLLLLSCFTYFGVLFLSPVSYHMILSVLEWYGNSDVAAWILDDHGDTDTFSRLEIVSILCDLFTAFLSTFLAVFFLLKMHRERVLYPLQEKWANQF